MIISSFNTKATGNTPKAKPTASNLSPEVGSILKTMMKSSKLSHQQQKVLDNVVLSKGLLPLSVERNCLLRQDIVPAAKPPRRHVRSLQTIIDSGDFQIEPYRSVPVKSRQEEIERFSNLMSGVSKVDDAPRRTRHAKLDEEINEEEIDERRQWLQDMIDLGHGEKYKVQIGNEIAERLSRISKLSR